MNKPETPRPAPKLGDPDYAPKAGDVFYARAKPGLPNGQRSRGGALFSDKGDTRVTVAAEGKPLHDGEVYPAGAKEIVQDNALVVSRTATVLDGDLVAQIVELKAAHAADAVEKDRLIKQVAELRSAPPPHEQPRPTPDPAPPFHATPNPSFGLDVPAPPTPPKK